MSSEASTRCKMYKTLNAVRDWQCRHHLFFCLLCSFSPRRHVWPIVPAGKAHLRHIFISGLFKALSTGYRRWIVLSPVVVDWAKFWLFSFGELLLMPVFSCNSFWGRHVPFVRGLFLSSARFAVKSSCTKPKTLSGLFELVIFVRWSTFS